MIMIIIITLFNKHIIIRVIHSACFWPYIPVTIIQKTFIDNQYVLANWNVV